MPGPSCLRKRSATARTPRAPRSSAGRPATVPSPGGHLAPRPSSGRVRNPSDLPPFSSHTVQSLSPPLAGAPPAMPSVPEAAPALSMDLPGEVRRLLSHAPSEVGHGPRSVRGRDAGPSPSLWHGAAHGQAARPDRPAAGPAASGAGGRRPATSPPAFPSWSPRRPSVTLAQTPRDPLSPLRRDSCPPCSARSQQDPSARRCAPRGPEAPACPAP